MMSKSLEKGTMEEEGSSMKKGNELLNHEQPVIIAGFAGFGLKPLK